MKDIKIIVDGPLSRDVKLLEIDGHDLTHMATRLEFISDVRYPNIVIVRLVGNVSLEIEYPLEAQDE